jgi:hypothetical protein
LHDSVTCAGAGERKRTVLAGAGLDVRVRDGIDLDNAKRVLETDFL